MSANCTHTHSGKRADTMVGASSREPGTQWKKTGLCFHAAAPTPDGHNFRTEELPELPTEVTDIHATDSGQNIAS